MLASCCTSFEILSQTWFYYNTVLIFELNVFKHQMHFFFIRIFHTLTHTHTRTKTSICWLAMSISTQNASILLQKATLSFFGWRSTFPNFHTVNASNNHSGCAEITTCVSHNNNTSQWGLLGSCCSFFSDEALASIKEPQTVPTTSHYYKIGLELARWCIFNSAKWRSNPPSLPPFCRNGCTQNLCSFLSKHCHKFVSCVSNLYVFSCLLLVRHPVCKGPNIVVAFEIVSF